MKDFKSQSGNVLIIIFIAIALFSALSFTVADIMRTGDPQSIAREQSYLYADELLDYAQNLRLAVQDVRISNGCSDTDISFENNNVSGYAHAPAASDLCKIFHPAGGGMSYIPPNERIIDTAFSSQAAHFYKNWFFTGTTSISSLGTSEPDLITNVIYVRLSVCEAINDRAGIANPPPTVTLSSAPARFNGSYSADNVLGAGADIALEDKPFFCSRLGNTSSAGSYIFTYNLLAR